MRRASINSATFIFMSRGEKLQKQDLWGNAFVLDNRYVLWPSGDQWDVRFMTSWSGCNEWVGIAEQRFSDESAAWLAALNHWESISHQRKKLGGE